MASEAYVTFPGDLSEQEREGLASELRDAGLDLLSVQATGERIFGIDDALFVGLIVASLHGFFEGFGEEAGKDAYKSLKRLISRLSAKAHRRDNGIVILQDQQSGARADLTPDLDDAAYSALLELDFEAYENVTLVWDRDAQEWRRSE